jgi:hypothetical protein
MRAVDHGRPMCLPSTTVAVGEIREDTGVCTLAPSRNTIRPKSLRRLAAGPT